MSTEPITKDLLLTKEGLDTLVNMLKANYIANISVANGKITVTKGDGTTSQLPLDSENTVYYSYDGSTEVNAVSIGEDV